MVSILSKACPCMRALVSRTCNVNNINGPCKFSQTCRRRVLAEKYDKENYLNKKPNSKTEVGAISLCMLIVPGTCFMLAIWQYNRKQWKDKLVGDMELKTIIPAVDLPTDLTNKRSLEYRRVRVRGEFDHSREMYVGPRSCIEDLKFKQSQDGFFSPFQRETCNIGYIVVTPFKLADRDLTILVNRGWIPNDKINPKTRLEGQITGEVELEGIIRMQEEKPKFINSDRSPASNVFRYRDIDDMAEFGKTSYIFIDAIKETTVPGGPIGGQTQIQMKNEHLQYMVTWIAIGTYLSFMWHRRYVRRLQ